MKKLLSLLFAGAMMIVLGVACEKGEDPPMLKPPLEVDDSLFFYAESGEKMYFTLRKDRVFIRAASYDDAQAMSTLEVLRFGDGTANCIGEWVFGTIDSTQITLSDVLALPGAIDATYGLEYKDGTMQYPMNSIFVRFKSGITPQQAQALEQAGFSREVISIELESNYSPIYQITLNVSVGGILRRCRELYESGQCVFVEPNFFRESTNQI